MKKSKRRNCWRQIVGMILSLAVCITTLPMMGISARAEGESEPENTLSTSSAILNLESQEPTQFDTMVAAGDIYGQGDNAFLLSEQNELYLYWSTKSEVFGVYYDNLDMTIRSESEGYSWVDSINAVNSGAHGADMSNIGNGQNGFRYVRGTSFDAAGSGRREYAACECCKSVSIL